MAFYEASEGYPELLRKLKFCLDSFPPSSVKSERCFRVAGTLISRLRSSLNEKIAESLYLVRSCFKK